MPIPNDKQNQNEWNMCECSDARCNCLHDTDAEDRLCMRCRLSGHTAIVRTFRASESDRARTEGDRRFGSECRHESVYFGQCSYCGRRVVAAGGAA
jgi:hypothetical protein